MNNNAKFPFIFLGNITYSQGITSYKSPELSNEAKEIFTKWSSQLATENMNYKKFLKSGGMSFLDIPVINKSRLLLKVFLTSIEGERPLRHYLGLEIPISHYLNDNYSALFSSIDSISIKTIKDIINKKGVNVEFEISNKDVLYNKEIIKINEIIRNNNNALIAFNPPEINNAFTNIITSKNFIPQNKKTPTKNDKKNVNKKKHMLILLIMFSIIPLYMMFEYVFVGKKKKDNPVQPQIISEDRIEELLNKFTNTTKFKYIFYLKNKSIEYLNNNNFNSIRVFDLKEEKMIELSNIKVFKDTFGLLLFKDRDLYKTINNLLNESFFYKDSEGNTHKKITFKNAKILLYEDKLKKNKLEIIEKYPAIKLDKKIKIFLKNNELKINEIKKYYGKLIFINETEITDLYTFSYLQRNNSNWKENEGIIYTTTKDLLIKKAKYKSWWMRYFKKIQNQNHHLINIEDEPIVKELLKRPNGQGILTESEKEKIINMLIDKLIN